MHDLALVRCIGRGHHLEQLAGLSLRYTLSIEQLEGAIVVQQIECLRALLDR
ncbi:hypothetical protein D3C76_1881250 [compost metagenome]